MPTESIRKRRFEPEEFLETTAPDQTAATAPVPPERVDPLELTHLPEHRRGLRPAPPLPLASEAQRKELDRE